MHILYALMISRLDCPCNPIGKSEIVSRSKERRPRQKFLLLISLLLFSPSSALRQVPTRNLMGPGPSNAYPRVLAAQALPLLGHMHPPTIKIMDEYVSIVEFVLILFFPSPCVHGFSA